MVSSDTRLYRGYWDCQKEKLHYTSDKCFDRYSFVLEYWELVYAGLASVQGEKDYFSFLSDQILISLVHLKTSTRCKTHIFGRYPQINFYENCDISWIYTWKNNMHHGIFCCVWSYFTFIHTILMVCYNWTTYAKFAIHTWRIKIITDQKAYLTLSRQGFKKLAQTGEGGGGGIRSPLTPLPLPELNQILCEQIKSYQKSLCKMF